MRMENPQMGMNQAQEGQQMRDQSSQLMLQCPPQGEWTGQLLGLQQWLRGANGQQEDPSQGTEQSGQAFQQGTQQIQEQGQGGQRQGVLMQGEMPGGRPRDGRPPLNPPDGPNGRPPFDPPNGFSGRPSFDQQHGPRNREPRQEAEMGCDLTFTDARNSTKEFTAEVGTNVERELKDFVSQATFYESQLKRSHRPSYVNYLVASKVVGRAKQLMGVVNCETVAQLREALERACTMKVGPHNLIRRMMSCHQGSRPIRQFVEELRDIEQRLLEEQPGRSTDYKQMMLGVLMSNTAEKYATRLTTVMPRSWEEAVDYLEKVAMAEPVEETVTEALTEEVQVTFAEGTKDTQSRDRGRWERHPNATPGRESSYDRAEGDRNRGGSGHEAYRSRTGDRERSYSRDRSRDGYRNGTRDRSRDYDRQWKQGYRRDRSRDRGREGDRGRERGREGNRWRSRDRDNRSASREVFRDRSRTRSRGRDDNRKSIGEQIQDLERLMKKALTMKKSKTPKNGARTSASGSEDEE